VSGCGLAAAALAAEVCTVTVAVLAAVPLNVIEFGETVQVEDGGPPLQVNARVWLDAVPGVNDTVNVAGCSAVTVALELPDAAAVNGVAFTTCTNAELELPVKLGLPPYEAVMLLLPTANALLLQVAVPPLSATVASVVVPFRNVTEPAGTPDPPEGLTVAVIATVCPAAAGFRELLRVTVVLAGVIPV